MNQANILVVDRTPQDLELLTTILRQQNYEVRCVSQGKIAIQVAQSGWVDLILLDTELTDINSYELCQQLKNNPLTKVIPLIFIANFSHDLNLKTFQVGGNDYLLKPLQKQEILSKITSQIQESKIKAQVRQLEVNNQQLSAEILKRQEAQEQLLMLALHDSITGLPNRNSFLATLKQLMPKYEKQKEYQFALLLLDFNVIITPPNSCNFTVLKSYLNYIEIKQLLNEVATRIQKCLPSSATLSRFESNEFAIILTKITEGEKELTKWAEIIQEEFKFPLQVSATRKTSTNKQKIALECEVGIVTNCDRYGAAYELLHDAEIALYRAKKNPHRYYQFFPKKPTSSTKKRQPTVSPTSIDWQLKSHFIEALTRNRIELSYQPIFSLQKSTLQQVDSFKIKGMEVFDNQQENYHKLIVLTNLCQDFNPADLNHYVSEFTLETACSVLLELQSQHEAQQSLFLTMECNENFLHQRKAISKIKQILTTTQLSRHYLHLDLILENSSLTDKTIISLLEQLKKLGIKLNLVCKNISYNNLKEIHNLPFNGLTLANNLIGQIVVSEEALNSQSIKSPNEINSPSSPSFARSEIAKIINLAHANQMTVTAKDIATQVQINYLASVGCDYGQGEFFSQPLDRESLEMFLVWRI